MNITQAVINISAVLAVGVLFRVVFRFLPSTTRRRTQVFLRDLTVGNPTTERIDTLCTSVQDLLAAVEDATTNGLVSISIKPLGTGTWMVHIQTLLEDSAPLEKSTSEDQQAD